jgi:hypothetical protein
MSYPEYIELADIDPKWKAYAVQIRRPGAVHVKSWAEYSEYTICGNNRKATIVTRRITCRKCIKALIDTGKLVKR